MPDDIPTAEFRDLLQEERSDLRVEAGRARSREGSELTYDSNFADSSQVTAERSEAEALVASLQRDPRRGRTGDRQARSGHLRTLRDRAGARSTPSASKRSLRLATASIAHRDTDDVGAPWPSRPPQGPRRRVDPRWLTVIVVAVIVVIVLVRQKKIHISEHDGPLTSWRSSLRSSSTR